MSMLPYESVPQREGELQSQSHCVLCVCWVFFPLLELESPLWLSAQNALHAAPAHGAPRGALSLSGPATHHTAELPLWLLPDGRSFRWKGNPQKARWGGFKEQIPKLKAWMKYSRRTHHLKGKVSLQCISVWTSVLTVIFPNYPEEWRKMRTATSSNNPFDLTNEQNITVKLIRGLTVSECMVLHYPNICYFPWLRFEGLSIQVRLESDLHTVLSS